MLHVPNVVSQVCAVQCMQKSVFGTINHKRGIATSSHTKFQLLLIDATAWCELNARGGLDFNHLEITPGQQRFKALTKKLIFTRSISPALLCSLLSRLRPRGCTHRDP